MISEAWLKVSSFREGREREREALKLLFECFLRLASHKLVDDDGKEEAFRATTRTSLWLEMGKRNFLCTCRSSDSLVPWASGWERKFQGVFSKVHNMRSLKAEMSRSLNRRHSSLHSWGEWKSLSKVQKKFFSLLLFWIWKDPWFSTNVAFTYASWSPSVLLLSPPRKVFPAPLATRFFASRASLQSQRRIKDCTLAFLLL